MSRLFEAAPSGSSSLDGFLFILGNLSEIYERYLSFMHG
jgi:hypothetical protein